MLGREQSFFEAINGNNTIKEYIFMYEGIINKDTLDDVWSIYRVEDEKVNSNNLMSLRDLLFRETVHLTDQQADSFYCVAHAHLYRLLIAPQGLRHLAKIIQLLCVFLQELEGQGLNYGNLRAENIILSMSDDGQSIESLKLINFGFAQQVGQPNQSVIPEQVDHLPPEELQRLSEILDNQVANEQSNAGQNQQQALLNTLNTNYDVFSLGILILQVIIGCPTQLQMPIKIRCKTVDGQAFTDTPVFGQSPLSDQIVDQAHISTLI